MGTTVSSGKKTSLSDISQAAIVSPVVLQNKLFKMSSAHLTEHPLQPDDDDVQAKPSDFCINVTPSQPQPTDDQRSTTSNPAVEKKT